MLPRVPVAFVVSAALLSACGGNNTAKPTPEPSTPPPAAPSATQKPAAVAPPVAPPPSPTAAASATPPTPAEPEGYPLSAIKAIPDNCKTPSVILASAPKSVGGDYAWNITRQALLANQQFRVIDGVPTGTNEVHLAPFDYNATAYALVATCADGGTCNRLAAMYKAIVRSSNPQLTCGKVQGIGTSPSGRFRWAATPQGNLPDATDTVALCARLDACMIATTRSTPGDPFLECQKAPTKFNTKCAAQYPCAPVMSCIGK